MATNFPGSQDSFTNPTSGDTLASPDHASQHADVNDAVEAIELALLDGAPLFIDDANERVGIGTTSPISPLHINGAGNLLSLQSTGTSDRSTIKFLTNGSDWEIGARGSAATPSNTLYIYDNDSSAYRMVIDTSGNVGIGTTTPAHPLHVTGSDNRPIRAESSVSGSYIDIQDSATTGEGYVAIGAVGDEARIIAGGTTRMTIDSSGNVGIGTTSPDQKVHIISDGGNLSSGDVSGETKGTIHLQNSGGTKGDGELSVGVSFSGTNTGRRRALIAAFQDGTDGDPHGLKFFTYGSTTAGSDAVASRMTIDSSGRVGINGDPSIQPGTEYMLFVEVGSGGGINIDYPTTSTNLGLIKGYSDVGGTDTLQFIIRTDGDFESRTNSYGATSDATIKQDIVDASSQWDDIKSVQLRKYRLVDDVAANGDDAVVQLGVVAQELEASGMGGLVVDADPDNDKPHKSVKYSVLELKALGALQEAMERIEMLEARIAVLEA